MPRRLPWFFALALLTLGISAVEPVPARAALTLPADFTDQLVTNVAKPTALAFTPDGRGLVATQPGVLRVIAPGQGLLPEPAIDLGPQLCSTYERGLLGAAVDPDFGANHHVFLFYTYRHGSTCGRSLDPSPENRVSRFTLGDNNRIDPGSEVVVLDHIPSRTGQHNAGDLHFGADGLVYVSTGDGYCRLPPGDETRCTSDNNNSRSLSHPLGKILRVAPDGSVPAGNPYVGADGSRRCGDPAAAGPEPGSGPCRETFASGLRNPFRFAVRPGTSDLYINDVGQDAWDEIDLGVAGASSDPDPGTGALSYRWDFGDGGPSTVSATPATTHEYGTAGTYTATLRVTDPGGLESSPVTRTVGIGVPNTAPAPKIVAPTTSTRFTVGQSITLKGKATDPEDGTLPAGALTWEVLIHHNNHTHPLVPPTAGNNVTFRAPPPENTAAAGNSYLEIHLTATDSGGLGKTVVQRFDAKRVTLTFKTTPDHLKLGVGGTDLTATKAVTSWVGYQMTVTAPTPQTLNGKKYRFSKWSDGKAATHKITTPSSNTTYKATFK